VALGLALCFVVPLSGFASERSHSKVLAAFRDVVSEPSKSTVQVFSDGHRSALGAIVGSDGFVLTKATELKGKLECQLKDGRRMEAQLIGKDPSLDLAMLKIDAKSLPVVHWSESESPAVGSWVATPGLERDPVAIGVLSVGPRKIAAPSGALGVQLDNVDDVAKILQVMPDSAAEKAGFEAGDAVTKVNGKIIASRQQLVETVRSYMPGDIIAVVVRRGEKELTLEAKLGSLSQLVHGDRADFQNNLGGQLSERRAGFVSVIQHDTVLQPRECGGPLVDLDGNVVGINIARAGRVESFALTTSAVKKVLGDLMSGKLGPNPDKGVIADSSKPSETKIP
jgi:serine protease Do